jgi:hypothetical protein
MYVMLNAENFCRVLSTSYITFYRNLPVFSFFAVMVLLKLISWTGSVSIVVSVISEGRLQGEHLVFMYYFK